MRKYAYGFYLHSHATLANRAKEELVVYRFVNVGSLWPSEEAHVAEEAEDDRKDQRDDDREEDAPEHVVVNPEVTTIKRGCCGLRCQRSGNLRVRRPEDLIAFRQGRFFLR
jgi:hypothetical protein